MFDPRMQVGDYGSQRFGVFARDALIKAGDQRSATHRVYGHVGNGVCLDGHAQIKAQLQQQLIEDVLLGPPGLDVVNGSVQRIFEIVRRRIPGADIGCVQPEDTKAEIALVVRVFVLDLACSAPKPFRNYSPPCAIVRCSGACLV